jgi:hypothetical protein
MKRPWQFGLLALAFTGVSTYNILFFKNYNSSQPAPTQNIAEPAAVVSVTENSVDAPEQPGSSLLPPISREELQRKAQYAFVPKELPTSETSPWPNRDPFSLTRKPSPVISTYKKAQPVQKEKLPSINISEPECVFTGTLIDHERKLALINGTPQSIGARIGAWEIVHIDSDYVILQSGEKTRRIELTNVRRQVAQKEPL